MTRDVILANGGIDLMTARVASNPGSLRDCLNYEVDTNRGYTAIKGFARYDGRSYPNREIRIISMDLGSVSGTFKIGENLTINGNEYGVVRDIDSGTYYIEVTGDRELENDVLVGSTSGATGEVPATVNDPATGYNPSTGAEWLTSFEALAEAQREAVEWCGGNILGTHYFNDTSWVVRDNVVGYELTDLEESGAGTLTNLAVGTHVKVYEENSGASVTGEYIGRIESFAVVSGSLAGANTVHISIKILSTGLNSQGSGLPAATTTKIVQIQPLYRCRFENGSTFPDYANDTFSGWVIEELSLESGTWDGGDAAGFLYARYVSAAPSVGTFTGSSTSSSIDIAQAKEGSALTYATTSYVDVGQFSDSDAYQLLKSTGAGWDIVDMGYEVAFNTGASEPDTILDFTIDPDAIDAAGVAGDWKFATALSTEATTGSTDWTTNPGAGDTTDPSSLIAALADEAGETDADIIWATPAVGGATNTLVLKDFNFNVDSDASIVGVEVQTSSEADATFSRFSSVALRTPDGVGSYNQAGFFNNLSTTGFTDKSFGGSSNLWGLELTPEIVNDPDFCLRIRLNSATGDKIYLDHIKVRLHILKPSLTVYFNDGSSDVSTAEIVYLQRFTGTWAGGDAAGVATLRDVSNPDDISSGMSVYTEGAAGGTRLFDTSSTASKNSLPGRSLLDSHNSRYVFNDANFYARESLRMIFGANGASFPFVITENFFFRFRINPLAPDQGYPRHVARHGDRLMLGLNTGEVILSGPGEPANFETTAGVSDSYGSAIHGLIPMTGESIAVLTKDEVVVLQGTDPGTWVKNKLDTEAGCIEYTAVDMGSPIYLDSRGVSSISAVEAYGDFQRGRLTYAIEPWLRPRIQRFLSGVNETKAPVVAIPVRSKSQYMLFFKDGYAMSMTFTGDEAPQCMFRRYKVDSSDLDILAVGEGKDSSGQDRVFFSHTGSGFLYEMNRGLSFDGDGIGLSLEFNSTWMDPSREWNPQVFHVFGNVDDQATLDVSTITDFSHEVSQDRLLIRSDTEAHDDEEIGFYAQGRVKARGVTAALKMSRDAAIKPTHTIQAYQWARPRSGREER